MSHTAATPTLDYIRKLYAPQDALLARIDAALHARDMAIHIGPEEGKLLQIIMKLRHIKTVVEIGTLAGYSAIWMARALPKGGRVYTINKDPEHIKLAKGFIAESDVKDCITMLEGDALSLLPGLKSKGPFDMVFIDADKINYPNYLDWAEKHVRKDGLIVADNTFLFGAVLRDEPLEGVSPTSWEAMKTFNERLADTDNYFSTIIPTEQGLSVAIKLF